MSELHFLSGVPIESWVWARRLVRSYGDQSAASSSPHRRSQTQTHRICCQTLCITCYLHYRMLTGEKQGDLTHWGRVIHICIGKLTIIGSDNSLSHGWGKALIWTSAGILLLRTLGTNYSEILSEIHTFSLMKMHLKKSCVKWRPFCGKCSVIDISVEKR